MLSSSSSSGRISRLLSGCGAVSSGGGGAGGARVGERGSGEVGGEGLWGSAGGTRPKTSCTLWGSSWRVGGGGEKSAVLPLEGGEGCWERSGTHRASGQLPVEGLSPRQHVLHAQLHGQLVDMLWEGVGQACLPASTQPPLPERPLCASCWGYNGGKTDWVDPGGWGGRGGMPLQAACHRQDTTKGKDPEIHPCGPASH